MRICSRNFDSAGGKHLSANQVSKPLDSKADKACIGAAITTRRSVGSFFIRCKNRAVPASLGIALIPILPKLRTLPIRAPIPTSSHTLNAVETTAVCGC